MTDVPAPIRSHLRTLQPEWQAWLEWLPGAREAAVERWGLTLGPVVSQSVGSAVYHVTRRGRPAVLKLVTPGEFFDQQVATKSGRELSKALSIVGKQIFQLHAAVGCKVRFQRLPGFGLDGIDVFHRCSRHSKL